MIDTNDVFNDAVRGSTLHNEENDNANGSLAGSKIVSVLLLAGIAYVAFNYYTKNMKSEDLVVTKQVVAEIQAAKPTVVASVDVKPNNSEEEYLDALKSIESELTAERETVNLNTEKQMNLATAMSSLTDETKLAENTSYTRELKKEIGENLEKVETPTVVATNNTKEKSRKVIVKKGDTLEGLSNKFYGNAQNYKRIIASNDNLHTTDDTIYAGETILLPY